MMLGNMKLDMSGCNRITFQGYKFHWSNSFLIAVADPGFPRGGGANSPGGAPTYDFAKISQKLHEIERIWAPGGGGGARPKFYYVDPPLNSTSKTNLAILIFLYCGEFVKNPN